MTNEQKIKAYLEAGHYVKVNLLIDDSIIIVYDNGLRFVSSDGSTFYYVDFNDKPSVEPIPRKPPYKVWEKVKVLDIARDIEEYNLLDSDQQEMIWWVYIIESIDGYWIRLNCSPDTRYDDSYTFPSWCLAPAVDSENIERKTRIQELELQLVQIRKDLELLKV